MQEVTSILKEDGLNMKSVRVKPEHAEQDYSQKKACNSHSNFPSSIYVKESR